MSSTPALVRVSAIMINPASSSMPRQYGIWAGSSSALRLELRLLQRFADLHLYRQFLGAATRTCADHRRRVAIVEPAGDADIGIVGAHAVGRIEGDPAKVADPGFRPGVRRLLHPLAVAAEQMAGDVAGRNAEMAGGADQHVREILADAMAGGTGGFRRRVRPRCFRGGAHSPGYPRA